MSKTGGGEAECAGAAVSGPAEGGGQRLHACIALPFPSLLSPAPRPLPSCRAEVRARDSPPGAGKRAAEAGSGDTAKKSRVEKSCIPPAPKDLAAHTAIWDDVCLMAKAMAEATPDEDCLRMSAILSEEEFYRQRLTRVTDLLATYQ
jgi:hypothetical protein